MAHGPLVSLPLGVMKIVHYKLKASCTMLKLDIHMDMGLMYRVS